VVAEQLAPRHGEQAELSETSKMLCVPRRFAISNAFAVTALLFGILLMHGLSTAASHGEAHQHEDQPDVALVPSAEVVGIAESGGSHTAHLLCLCTCVLMAGVAGALLAIGLTVLMRPHGAGPVGPLAYRYNLRATSRPEPRRRPALLSVALH
jgi:hypothetical protein